MKEWLLKDEKLKVGRPRLADSKVIKKAKILICISAVIVFFLCFSFFSVLKGTTPINLAKELMASKFKGVLSNENGFLVKEYYDKNSNYVIEVKVPDVIYNYSGSYTYTLYEQDGKKLKKKQEETFDKKTRNFKIKIKSLKNENKTYKIKLQIINAAKITENYAPITWGFIDASKNEDMYAYKTFTVKGYYSPVTNEEIKETKESEDKITVTTNKNEPRCFILNVPQNVEKIKVTYTDSSKKEIVLANDKNVLGKKTYCVPNQNTLSKVTFKVYTTNDDLKLSNWDVNDNYISNTYVLKPEAAYKN